MGTADQIKAKVMQTPSGVQVGEVVARGDLIGATAGVAPSLKPPSR